MDDDRAVAGSFHVDERGVVNPSRRVTITAVRRQASI
jgi:hypothetical protein